MMKKFEEFVNEGLISDYKKQNDLMNREIKGQDKKYVLKVLRELNDVEMPFVFVAKNCCIYSGAVKEEPKDAPRGKVYHMEGEEFMDGFDDLFMEDIKVTELSILQFIESDVEKSIHKKIYKWFEETYEKDLHLTFDNKVRVDKMRRIMEKIRRELL